MNISNFYLYNPLLAAGGQPTTEHLSDLKEAKFDVIINLSPFSTRNALHEEAAIVEQLKMEYAHIPVDCTNLQPFHYLIFKGILNGFEGKNIFVHCGGNIKSSNLIHMYQVLENGMDENKSLQSLLQIQKPEKKWFEYFKLMGMAGIMA